MLHWLSRLVGGIRRNRPKNKPGSGELPGFPPDPETRTLSASLEQNKTVLREIFDRCADLIIREFSIGNQHPVRAMAVFLDPLVDYDLLQKDLLSTLMNINQTPPRKIIGAMLESIIPAGKIELKNRWVEVEAGVAEGLVGLFIEGENTALLISYAEDTSRAISKPVTERTIRGPGDAFNEDLRTNLALVRKRLHTSRLAVENMEIGAVTKMMVCVVYLKGYVMPGLVEEIKKRLERIKVDGFVSAGQAEEFIVDSRYSPFNTIAATERPDLLVSRLLEGRAAIMFDNTPFCLIAPNTIATDLQSPEDYYHRYWFSSFIRLIRWGALFTFLLLPSAYIAVTTFHHEMIPTNLVNSIMAAPEGVPFPAFLEALLMELAFEVIREAGIRSPGPFTQTISIVGAIVIGQTAVAAGLVSSVMVVVVALTAITSFAIPSLTLSTALRPLRFLFMISAASMGLFGVMIGLSVLTFHLASLRSFGVPYLSPFAPLSWGDLKDAIIRVPAWRMKLRPRLIGYNEPQRQEPGLGPQPPKAGGNTNTRTKRGER